MRKFPVWMVSQNGLKFEKEVNNLDQTSVQEQVMADSLQPPVKCRFVACTTGMQGCGQSYGQDLDQG